MQDKKDEDSSPKRPNSPHNRFVLGYFASPREAKGMLEVQLPPSLLRVIDLDRLEIENSILSMKTWRKWNRIFSFECLV